MRYYKRVDAQEKTTTVESYWHNKPVAGAVEIGKAEYDAFIALLPAPAPLTIRDLGKELDALKAELATKGIIENDAP